uniref:THIF-type NAD/FAD binding fold domain-containing protein n=1 Tax=Tetradesmus obliquus TaxID=3088 RepID=A0A383W5L4_TETOB|eukprot:jgi/Sobl393_1/9033/SZX72429.1
MSLPAFCLQDGDSVDTTNRNRQLPALRSSVGQLKAAVVAARLRDINPDLRLTVKQQFLDPLAAAALVQEQTYDYVIDCIDSIAPKQALLLAGHAAGAHVISSMGAGGRLDPSKVRLADLSETYNDAFAAVVREGLRKAGVSSGITVVFSDELAKPASLALTQQQYKKSYFGTSSYIPGLFGLYIASHVIRRTVEEGYKVPPVVMPGSIGKQKSSSSSSSTGKGSKKSSRSKKLGNIMSVSGSSSSSSSVDANMPPVQLLQQQQSVPAALEPGTPRKAAPNRSGAGRADVLRSFDQAQGQGMGYDGGGI